MFPFTQHFHDHQFILEVVEHDDVFIEDVVHIRSIVSTLRAVFHRNVLKVAHSIERSVAVKSAVVAPFALYVETT